MAAGSLPLRPTVLGDLVATSRVRQAALVAGFAATIALAAQISIPLPVGPVPLTAQTLAVLLGGAALGPGRALSGAGLYLGLGVVGVPWFAVTGGATSGYLVGFVLAAGLVGAGARAGHDRRVGSTMGLMVVGNLVIYALGVAGLMVVTGMAMPAALASGVVPFLIGDAIKIGIAAALLPTAWRLVDDAERA